MSVYHGSRGIKALVSNDSVRQDALRDRIRLMDSGHVRLQFRRLARHTQAAAADKDEISLLDMTHCLRIFVDMKAAIDQYVQENEIQVVWPNPVWTSNVKKVYRGSLYLQVPLAAGVETGGVQVKGLTISDKALTPEEVQQRFRSGQPQNAPTNLTFSEWFGSETIKVTQDEAGERRVIGISREMLIKRVANFLGASHPEGSESSVEYENSFDLYIGQLHQDGVADFPLTYYQLMEIAQTIVAKLESYLR
jgi:hypothetical protein